MKKEPKMENLWKNLTELEQTQLLDVTEKIDQFKIKHDDLLRGRDHELAIAIHKTTDLPIFAVIKQHQRSLTLIHCGVQLADDFIDAGGLRSRPEIAKDFHDEITDATEFLITSPEMISKLVYGEEHLPEEVLEKVAPHALDLMDLIMSQQRLLRKAKDVGIEKFLSKAFTKH